MSAFFRYFLLIYFATAILLVGLLRFVLVKKQVGENPAIKPDSDTAEGVIALYFAVLTVFGAAVVVVVALLPRFAEYLVPIPFLDEIHLKDAGCGILIASLVWIFVAQHQMRNSWRFGIHEETKTDLITAGLFSISRNPIYAGMVAMLLGFFLVFPAAATLLILVAGYILIQIQIRLEEQYLTKCHGEKYLSYKKKVRRLI